ncbi:hypothetical protein pb186bvf_017472, partial [Paramecium bursaria]
MYKKISILLPCRHTCHRKCANKLEQTQSNCLLCDKNVKEYHNIHFQGEEHVQLDNQDLIPKCVAEKLHQYEVEIIKMKNEKLILEQLQIKKKFEQEFLIKQANSNLIDLVKDFDQNQIRIQYYDSRIKQLQKESKALKQQADQ